MTRIGIPDIMTTFWGSKKGLDSGRVLRIILPHHEEIGNTTLFGQTAHYVPLCQLQLRLPT
jgi:hypothetical protein